MREQKILHVLLFFVFFAAGTAALSSAILIDELSIYYQNKHLLAQTGLAIEDLQDLNTSYDLLLENMEEDPNLIDRIAPLVLGTDREPNENIAFPKATIELLDAAEKAVKGDSVSRSDTAELPDWLIRCKEPQKRIMLFISGAVLILIAFVCFGVRTEIVPQTDDLD